MAGGSYGIRRLTEYMDESRDAFDPDSGLDTDMPPQAMVELPTS